MSFQTHVCCNAQGIDGKGCEIRGELDEHGTPPPGWIMLYAFRMPSIEDFLATSSGRIFRVMHQQLAEMGSEDKSMLDKLVQDGIAAVPRVSIEAHLCPRHAGSMPIVEWVPSKSDHDD